MQPHGFEAHKKSHKVCEFNRFIYSLKQALRRWNLYFDGVVKSLVSLRTKMSHVSTRRLVRVPLHLVLYVDCIFLIRNNVGVLTSIKTKLSSMFSMKDLGEVIWILDIHIYQDRAEILMGLSQALYILMILKRFRMEASNRGLLPFRLLAFIKFGMQNFPI